jgi:diguanylate cyclase (GGDEF)-like protein
MWKYLVVQGVIFLLFFQPPLLASRRVRYLLFLICLGLSIAAAYYLKLDPFAWLLYACALFLTYWTANKALRWVFQNRTIAKKESRQLLAEEAKIHARTEKKENAMAGLQRQIQRVSDIYENVKEMSGSLELLTIFLGFAEAVVKNFPVKRVRMFELKTSDDERRMIESIYQADVEKLKLRPLGSSVMTDRVMFQGQFFPQDVKLVSMLSRLEKPIYLMNPGDVIKDETDEIKLPPGSDSLAAYPLSHEDEFQVVILIEGAKKEDMDGLSILTNRFNAEFRRLRLYEHVQQLATTDWLTDLYVRRYFFKRLEEEIHRCQRFNLKFSFVMIDIDDFKSYNDRYGHLVGDAVLKKTAEIIRQNVREVDLVGRYGGEEFSAILLDTDAEAAMVVSQRIRSGIDEHKFEVYDEEIRLTVSVGVATYSSKIKQGNEIVEWADSALYQAKRQGKNRVCAYM